MIHKGQDIQICVTEVDGKCEILHTKSPSRTRTSPRQPENLSISTTESCTVNNVANQNISVDPSIATTKIQQELFNEHNAEIKENSGVYVRLSFSQCSTHKKINDYDDNDRMRTRSNLEHAGN